MIELLGYVSRKERETEMIDRYEEFTAAISSIYKSIQKIKRDEMARFGLKGPHVQCLVALGRQRDGATITQLCELCELDKAAISRAVSELETQGVIEARQGGGRVYRAPLCLTEKGRRIADEVGSIIRNRMTLTRDGLSEQEREIFFSALLRISDNLQRLTPDGANANISKGKDPHEQ